MMKFGKVMLQLKVEVMQEKKAISRETCAYFYRVVQMLGRVQTGVSLQLIASLTLTKRLSKFILHQSNVFGALDRSRSSNEFGQCV